MEGSDLWFAKGGRVQGLASDCLVHSLQTDAKSTHSKASEIVRRRPDNIVVREEDWWPLVEGFGARSKDTTLGHEEIENDLLVACPISAIGKHEDGFDVGFRKVPRSGIIVFLFGQLTERSGVGIVLDDISWCDDVLEAVAFGNDTAFFALSTNDKHGIVFVCHFPHGRVAANELSWRNLDFELLAELDASFLFSLATTVGDKDIRAETCVSGRSNARGLVVSHFDTICILAIENLHGFDCFWDRTTTTDEDTINIKRKSVLVGDRIFGRRAGIERSAKGLEFLPSKFDRSSNTMCI